MATYAAIYDRSVNGQIKAQIAVAISTEAKYKIQNSADPNEKAWATWVIPRAYAEAGNWQMVICTDPAIADAQEVRDEDVQAAVTAIVPTMVASYMSSLPATAMIEQMQKALNEVRGIA